MVSIYDLRLVGFTLVVVNKNQGLKTEEELILTNMAFTHGIHVWQINATIGCTNICKWSCLTLNRGGSLLPVEPSKGVFDKFPG
jgi:hypothetical protein